MPIDLWNAFWIIDSDPFLRQEFVNNPRQASSHCLMTADWRGKGYLFGSCLSGCGDRALQQSCRCLYYSKCNRQVQTESYDGDCKFWLSRPCARATWDWKQECEPKLRPFASSGPPCMCECIKHEAKSDRGIPQFFKSLHSTSWGTVNTIVGKEIFLAW